MSEDDDVEDENISLKRKRDEKDDDNMMGLDVQPFKKQKSLEVTLSSINNDIEKQLMENIQRTSSLAAPTMLLTGHQAEVYTLKFSPDGQSLASGSFDKQIFLWQVYGESKNYLVLRGHKNSVLELFWSSDSSHIYSASADKTAGEWDAFTGKRTKKMSEHTSFVHSICPARRSKQLCVTCSDDGCAKLWDLRQRKSLLTLQHMFPLTSVCFDDHATSIFTGGIDNLIRCWDTRKSDQESFILSGHRDTITSLRLDPYGSYLLSNSMDNDICIWDIRPFAPVQRCIKSFNGASNNFENSLIKSNWSHDGTMITSGSGDRMVYVWDTTTREIKYRLPGHLGCVNEADFHPKEPIVGSGSSDKRIYLGEIE